MVKNTKSAQFKNAVFKTKIKESVLTLLALVCISGGASAQTKGKQEKDRKAKTELKVGFSNISALELQKDKTVFYNDFMPMLDAKIEKGGFYGNVAVSELIIMNNGDFSTLNQKCLLETGKYFGPGAKIFLKAGREVTEFGSVFFNGVENMKYSTEKTIKTFGNLSERIVFGVQKDGAMIELGIIGTYGTGIFIIPNPKQADFWAKISRSFEKDGWKITFAAATELGNTNKCFGNITASNGRIGVTAGGNYCLETKAFNAYIRGAYTSVSSNITYIVQGLKQGDGYSVQLGISKNGVQGFLGVDNISATQSKAPEFTSTPTVSAGISYTFGRNKTF